MAIGTGTVKLSEIINEFGTNTTYGPNNLRSYLKCGGVISSSLITTAGTGSVTAPAGATRVRIRIWGAGGGGGGGRWSTAAGEGFPGGGGGSGGYVEKTLSVVGGLTQYFYTVGALGAGASGSAGAAGGDSSVQDIPYGGNMLLTAGGGGGGGYAGIGLDDGAQGAGGITSGGGDLNIVGNEGFGTGGTAPDGGTGAPRNSGPPTVVGSAPGGGGGGGLAIGGIAYGGSNGGNGGVEFIWYGAGVPEHENNVNVPTSGTVNFSNFRTIGTNVVDKDFESDNYTANFRRYSSGPGYFQQKGGVLSLSAAQALVLTDTSGSSIGAKGTIDSIGKSITATGQNIVLDSIFDYSITATAGIPNRAGIVLLGDQRSENWNAIRWISVTVKINNVSKKLYRMQSLFPRGYYNAIYNLTYWYWNDIFGFVNTPTSPYNFTCTVSTVADTYT